MRFWGAGAPVRMLMSFVICLDVHALVRDGFEAASKRGFEALQAGKLNLATIQFTQARQSDASSALPLLGLGHVAFVRQQMSTAEALYEQATRLTDDQGAVVEALNRLGVIRKARGDLHGAAEAYKAAIRMRAETAELHFNLGNVLHAIGDMNGAISSFQNSIKIKPRYTEAYQNLGALLQEARRSEEALSAYEQANELAPSSLSIAGQLHQQQLRVGHWWGYPQLRDWLRRVLPQAISTEEERESPLQPSDALLYPIHPSALRKLASRHAAQIAHRVEPVKHRATPGPAKGQLRVAYVTARCQKSQLSHMISSVFGYLSPTHHSTMYCLASPDESEEVSEMIAGLDAVHDASRAPAELLANSIAQQNSHMAIDLSGWTRGHRNRVFALKGAPIQIGYLEFPGTTGAAYIDYIITDRVTSPPAFKDYYSERLVWGPHTYQVNNHLMAGLPQVVKTEEAMAKGRQEWGLSVAGEVLVCFNQLHKITPLTFTVFGHLLTRRPASSLWLLESSTKAGSRLQQELRGQGVSGSERRLVMSTFVERSRHWNRIGLGDLFLDTLPWNAHSTATDSFWAGLPILTTPHEAFASRVAQSLTEAVLPGAARLSTWREFEDHAAALLSGTG